MSFEAIVALTLTFTTTAYAPAANPISGGWYAADGAKVRPITIACGPKYFGHIFEFDDVPPGTPRIRFCHDRGALVGDNRVDFAIVDGPSAERLKRALQWGVRPVRARVWRVPTVLMSGPEISPRRWRWYSKLHNDLLITS